MSTLLLVLENRTYREALAQALGQIDRFDAVVSVGSALEAVHHQQEAKADLVLIGLAGDAGVAAIRALRMIAPAATVVALGISDTTPEAVDWAEAGALAFVPETASLQDLLASLDLASRGESRHSASFTTSLMRRLRTVGRMSLDRESTRLTSREREIVILIDQGCSNKDIARRLGIEVATVKNHVHNILEKLHARRRSEAAALVAGRVV